MTSSSSEKWKGSACPNVKQVLCGPLFCWNSVPACTCPPLDLLFTINQPSRQKKKLGSENHGKVQIHRCHTNHMDMSTKHVFWWVAGMLVALGLGETAATQWTQFHTMFLFLKVWNHWIFFTRRQEILQMFCGNTFRLFFFKRSRDLGLHQLVYTGLLPADENIHCQNVWWEISQINV